MTFDEVVALYNAGTSHRSKERDRCSLLRLPPYFTGRRLADIRRVDVRIYIKHRQASGVTLATVKRELRYACAAVNFVRLEREIDLKNPFQSLGIPDAENRVRWISQDEASRLIRESARYARPPLLPCFIRLALNTGCRRSELLTLEWDRVDFDLRMITLEAMHTKAARRRTVPLNSGALSALKQLADRGSQRFPGSPWVFPVNTYRHVRSLGIGFKSACLRAGISDFRIHDLRHNCASWLVMSGVDLYVVRDVLGHSSVTQTEKYAHLSKTKLASALDALDYQ